MFSMHVAHWHFPFYGLESFQKWVNQIVFVFFSLPFDRTMEAYFRIKMSGKHGKPVSCQLIIKLFCYVAKINCQYSEEDP